MLGRPFAEFQAVQRFHAVSSGRDHAFDLVVFAFGNRQQQCVRIFQHRFGSLHGFIVVMEQYAVFQALAESFVGGMFQAGAVELGRFVFGRGHAVVELTVVRNQQNAGGVGIQASDGLHVDVAHVVGKQAEDAWILLRFVRSFVICRLMKQNVEIGHGDGGNFFAVNRQGVHLRRVDIVFGAIMDFAVDGNAVIVYQPLALLAAAEAL